MAFRSIVAVTFKSYGFIAAIQLNYPAMLYYLVYGIIAYLINFRKHKDNFLATLTLLTFVDSISNIIEALIRNNLTVPHIKVILVVGFARSFFAYILYWFYRKQAIYVQAVEHQKRYTQLNKLVSDIQAEMFYLKKSMNDIEQVMSKSYNLYENTKSKPKLKELTLDISREVHEIKKDYYRVIKGFESFLNNFEKDDSMKISDIFTIIKDNTLRYIKENKLNIKLTFFSESDMTLSTYYSLFSILNNLIINSIQSCKENDSINVYQYVIKDIVYFQVTDTGEGIDNDILPYIINPGFTTKFDSVTGKASTGIGLSHVKNILDELQGEMNIESELNKGTSVTIKIPKKLITGDK
ncbi:ATP-binding protein [Clostridium sp. 'deep sea']|uniref:ATP-binding protein n=1 Tax=Clostridium sp. 'deep sea' TaxID=2779445 RepID=UPI00189667F3|nr:ATP-binding protein [Clostridium sp. 'deep sea']QOR36307.1 ATP-binding protein [Clostridium sp. 'deep sea']